MAWWKKTRVLVQPRPDNDLVRFEVQAPGKAFRVYYSHWWRGHLHAVRLILSGYELVYVDPSGSSGQEIQGA